MLATVWCIFGSWGLIIKLNFCSDFEHKVWSRFWSWSSGKIFKLEFGQYFAADVLQRLWSWILVEILKLGLVNILDFKFSRGGDVWLRFWSKCLVENLKMKFDQDLCLNLWYDPIAYFDKLNSTLGSVVPLAMSFIFFQEQQFFSGNCPKGKLPRGAFFPCHPDLRQCILFSRARVYWKLDPKEPGSILVHSRSKNKTKMG